MNIHLLIALSAMIMGGINAYGGNMGNTCLWLVVCFYAASAGLNKHE
jgi:hypothetical protein